MEPDGTLIRNVDEFLKQTTDPEYKQIFRIPVDIDITMQPETDVIELKEFSERNIKKFTVKPEMRLRFTLGLVRFGRHVLNRRIRGLIDRDIIWEGGLEMPRITLFSRYRNGNCVTSKYVYAGDETGFALEHRKTIQVFKHPRDEEVKINY
ncbi:hypothetical protein BEWA_036640 [Theileria equi strain WA]|uniref:Uncharacterized protein n=1 Tax=Theileria equi strain WA TaxID=1537102 RepID=L1LEM3_THEEQ|nr:hypothetical protein BEWA_036640 [Theileria equi strain WA]EKX73628.1 hypothetical protein BEWA_036640 [Theileria equi strain WA]|eukprot:XP_004833080.1 hypothetical protein BEWA_036640 [Theileria equi strain WA]